MSDKAKQRRRDIQRRTGWSLRFCAGVVRALGYEVVSRAVDDATDLDALGRELGRRMGDVHRATATDARSGRREGTTTQSRRS